MIQIRTIISPQHGRFRTNHIPITVYRVFGFFQFTVVQHDVILFPNLHQHHIGIVCGQGRLAEVEVKLIIGRTLCMPACKAVVPAIMVQVIGSIARLCLHTISTVAVFLDGECLRRAAQADVAVVACIRNVDVPLRTIVHRKDIVLPISCRFKLPGRRIVRRIGLGEPVVLYIGRHVRAVPAHGKCNTVHVFHRRRGRSDNTIGREAVRLEGHSLLSIFHLILGIHYYGHIIFKVYYA